MNEMKTIKYNLKFRHCRQRSLRSIAPPAGVAKQVKQFHSPNRFLPTNNNHFRIYKEENLGHKASEYFIIVFIRE